MDADVLDNSFCQKKRKQSSTACNYFLRVSSGKDTNLKLQAHHGPVFLYYFFYCQEKCGICFINVQVLKIKFLRNVSSFSIPGQLIRSPNAWVLHVCRDGNH